MCTWRVRTVVIALVLAALGGCSEKKTIIRGQAGGELAGSGFPLPNGAVPRKAIV